MRQVGPLKSRVSTQDSVKKQLEETSTRQLCLCLDKTLSSGDIKSRESLLWILLKHVLHICPIKTVFQLELHRWKISWTLVFYNFKRLWHSASKEAFVIFGYIFAILPPSQPDWCCTQIFWKKFMVQIDLFPPSRYPLGWSCEFTQRNGLILVYRRSILCCDLKFNPSCQFMWYPL